MTIINLTPHIISVNNIFIAPSGEIARVTSVPGKSGEIWIEGLGVIPFTNPATFGSVEGLPKSKQGVVYIVSSLVATQCKYRDDVFSPDTSPSSAIRNNDGQIIGVKALVAASERNIHDKSHGERKEGSQ